MRMQWIPGLLSPPPLEGLGTRLNVATLTGSDRAMNLALLLEVIRTIFFLLSVSARLINK